MKSLFSVTYLFWSWSGETAEAQKLAMQLKEDLEAISNRVNQCASKPTGEMPTKAVVDKLGQLYRSDRCFLKATVWK